jgi:hypothetical protein
MKTFNDYYLINGFVDEPEYLSEGIFGNVWKKIKSGINRFITFIKNSITDLNAGDVTEISIRSLTGLREAKDSTWDLTSRIGYYHEFCVGFELANQLRDKVPDNIINQKGTLLRAKTTYRKQIEDNREKFKEKQQPNIDKELLRAEDGAFLVAEKIISEIASANDFAFLTFEITHTGTLESGKSKMDVSLMVRKQKVEGDKGIVAHIKASLKLYKKPKINLSNKTFASFINGVLFPHVDLKGKKFLNSFMAGNPKWEKLINKMMLHSDNWKKTKRDLEKDKSLPKGAARKAANDEINKARGFQTIRNGILETIFKAAYEESPEAKAGINKRVVEVLGLDEADDVYMVIGTEQSNMKVISSRSSEEFKALYEKLKGDFTISFKFPEDANIVSCYMSLELDGEHLLSTNYSFKEGDIFVQFIDLKEILPTEYEAA